MSPVAIRHARYLARAVVRLRCCDVSGCQESLDDSYNLGCERREYLGDEMDQSERRVHDRARAMRWSLQDLLTDMRIDRGIW
jgi:hypothetical protein